MCLLFSFTNINNEASFVCCRYHRQTILTIHLHPQLIRFHQSWHVIVHLAEEILPVHVASRLSGPSESGRCLGTIIRNVHNGGCVRKLWGPDNSFGKAEPELWRGSRCRRAGVRDVVSYFGCVDTRGQCLGYGGFRWACWSKQEEQLWQNYWTFYICTPRLEQKFAYKTVFVKLQY